jgi:hypothetical protein
MLCTIGRGAGFDVTQGADHDARMLSITTEETDDRRFYPAPRSERWVADRGEDG